MKHGNPSEWLHEEFQRRRARNAAYSLRAFARQLNLSAGRISQYFSGSRKISLKAAGVIAEKLNLSPAEEAAFLELVKRGNSSRKNASARKAMISDEQYSMISADAFVALADWHYFAILSLINVKNFRNDPSWMGERLGIGAVAVKAAIQRLKRLGLVEERGGKLFRTQEKIRTSSDVESRALRVSHEQGLQQAIRSLHEVEINLRDISSITMAINTAQIPEAKILIQNFRRSLADLLESGDKSEVYNLNVQLVPVTRLRGKNAKKS